MTDLIVNAWSARLGARVLPCAVGRGGIGEKQGEGDGVSPIGRMRLIAWFYRPDRLSGIKGMPIGPADIWSDDPKDPSYNRPAKRCPDYPFSHERMSRGDPLYDLIGVLDYNYSSPKPGAGSAIFLHVWRKPRHPTEGCIAFRLNDLLWLHDRLPIGANVILR